MKYLFLYLSLSLIALYTRNLLVLVFLFSGLISFGKTNLDSLSSIANDDGQEAANRLNALEILVQHYLYNKPDSAFELAELQLEISSSSEILDFQSKAINSKGIALKLKGEYNQAKELFERGLNVARSLQYKKGIADALTNIGELFMIQKNNALALEYYLQSLEISREAQYSEGIVNNLALIGDVHRNQNEYVKAQNYYQQGLALAENTQYKVGLGKSLNSVGIIYWIQSDYSSALSYFQRGLSKYEIARNDYGISMILNNIGNIYGEQDNYRNALDYYKKSLSIMNGFGDKRRIASFLYNMAFAYIGLENFPEALSYFDKSTRLYEELNDKQGIAENLNTIGNLYSDLGNYSKALDYANRSYTIAQDINNKSLKASALISIGNHSNLLGKHQLAVGKCKSGLKLYLEMEVPFGQKAACSCLYNTYKAMGNNKDALKYFELLTFLERNIQTDETAKQLQLMEFQKISLKDSVERAEEIRSTAKAHQEEIDRKDKTRNVLLGSGVAMLLLAGGFYNRWRYVNRSRAIISKEKERSDELLLNILPAEIAEELKEKGSADAQEFDLVSIVFTDFKGFTQASEKLTAKQVVETIHSCFQAFDDICGTYDLEKIKTIGDSYMAAGGIPVPSEDAVKNTVLAALEMQRFIMAFKQLMKAQNQPSFEMRVGIHTGPVVAGIVGVKKFQYDIWGDTVNTASRMESHGEIGRVNISNATYELLKDDKDFNFEYRGKVKAKGKGEVEMYFVALANQSDDRPSTIN